MTIKKTAVTVVAVLATMIACAQNFEGRIKNHYTYKSKAPGLTDQQLTSMMGSAMQYFIKGGNYKTTSNGTFIQWQLYINKDNRLYAKMTPSDTIFWQDGSTNPDSVLKVEMKEGVTEILGYKCNEVILTCRSGVQKYYFSPKLGVDISLYKKHAFGNWYEYLRAAKALPLKLIIEDKQFVMEAVATEVTPMKLDDKEFQLPQNAKTAKSPF